MADHTKVQTTDGLEWEGAPTFDSMTTAPDAIDPNPPWPIERDEAYRRENRIEALRATSRVVAGIYANGEVIKDSTTGAENVGKVVIGIAEPIAAWLEKGER